MALEPTRDATVRAKSSNGLLDAVSSKKRSRTAQPLTRQTLNYRSESRLTKCFTDDFEFGSDIYVLSGIDKMRERASAARRHLLNFCRHILKY